MKPIPRATRQDIEWCLRDITGTDGPGIAFNRDPVATHFVLVPTEEGLIVAHTGWRVVPCVLDNKVMFRIVSAGEPLTNIGPYTHPLDRGAFIFVEGIARHDPQPLDITHPTNWKVNA